MAEAAIGTYGLICARMAYFGTFGRYRAAVAEEAAAQSACYWLGLGELSGHSFP